MNNRPTPETDCESGFFDMETAVSAAFARRIERERDEALEIAKRAIDDLAWFSETNARRLRAELDQIKEGRK